MSQPNKELHRLRLGAIASLYLSLFLTILWLAYTNRIPGYLSVIPYYDKFGHLILYALAAYLGHRCLGYRTIGSWRLPLFPVLFAAFTLTEELIQHLSPYRTLDAIDLIASVAGIGLGWFIAERGRQRQSS